LLVCVSKRDDQEGAVQKNSKNRKIQIHAILVCTRDLEWGSLGLGDEVPI
jgi:hypothetical protein